MHELTGNNSTIGQFCDELPSIRERERKKLSGYDLLNDTVNNA